MKAGQVRLIAGLDEVGRGCIAGSVIAAAVLLPEDACPLNGLADSKTLTPKRRTELAVRIETEAIAWAIGRAEVAEIDRLNILWASLLAMRRAYDSLSLKPDWAWVDGNRYPGLPCPGAPVVGGDRTVPAISAASILAKVYRDREMEIADRLFPGYGFAIHKGYPTPFHQNRLRQLGPSPLHRVSFGPVRKLMACAATPAQ